MKPIKVKIGRSDTSMDIDVWLDKKGKEIVIWYLYPSLRPNWVGRVFQEKKLPKDLKMRMGL